MHQNQEPLQTCLYPCASGIYSCTYHTGQSTDAWALADVPPPVAAYNSFPSILIGRPSLTLATTGITSPSCISSSIIFRHTGHQVLRLIGIREPCEPGSQLAAKRCCSGTETEVFQKVAAGAFVSISPLSSKLSKELIMKFILRELVKFSGSFTLRNFTLIRCENVFIHNGFRQFSR